jgi:hypothetical protein
MPWRQAIGAHANNWSVVNMLIHLYAVSTWGEESKADVETPHANGGQRGHTRVDRRIRDAQEFELEGLMSDDEDDRITNGKEGQPAHH